MRRPRPSPDCCRRPRRDQLGQARQLLNENGRRNYTLAQQPPDKAQLAGLGTVIESSNTGYAKLMDSQLNALETNLRQRAADHRSDAILNATIVAVALALALLLVLALMRSLLVPIRAVRQGALDVATNRLPEAVAAMRDGEELPEFDADPGPHDRGDGPARPRRRRPPHPGPHARR